MPQSVGWVYQYELVEPYRPNDLSHMRSLQDWYLAISSKPSRVAEVASWADSSNSTRSMSIQIYSSPITSRLSQVDRCGALRAITR